MFRVVSTPESAKVNGGAGGITTVEKRAVGGHLEPVPLKALTSASDPPFRTSDFLDVPPSSYRNLFPYVHVPGLS